jgi:hypothetical protein
LRTVAFERDQLACTHDPTEVSEIENVRRDLVVQLASVDGRRRAVERRRPSGREQEASLSAPIDRRSFDLEQEAASVGRQNLAIVKMPAPTDRLPKPALGRTVERRGYERFPPMVPGGVFAAISERLLHTSVQEDDLALTVENGDRLIASLSKQSRNRNPIHSTPTCWASGTSSQNVRSTADWF